MVHGAGLPALALIALIAATTLLAYRLLGSNGFVALDDDGYIYNNPAVQAGLTWPGLRYAFTTTDMANWHPLTWLSHQMDVRLFGLSPGRHHLSSLAIHVATAALLFLFLLRATGALWRSGLVTLLFALHPLHVESVAWASERKDVLSGLFASATLLAYLRFARRPGTGRMGAVAALLALGLLAKPMLVTLPFLFLLLDYWPLNRLGERGAAPAAILRALREKLPLFGIAALLSFVTYFVQSAQGTTRAFTRYTLLLRAGNAALAYLAYLGKTIWPAKLAVFYPHPAAGLSWGRVLLSAAILAAVSAAALLGARRRPFLLAGWLWFLGMLVPVIGLVQVGDQAYADRYTYLPLTGLFLAGVWGGAGLLPRPGLRSKLIAAAAVAAVAAFAVLTHRQTAHWHDSETLFRHAAAVTEGNWIAHAALGEALAVAGRDEEAAAQIAESLRINPRYAEAHNTLGLLAFERGEFAAAVLHFRRSATLRRTAAEPLFNLGLAYEKLGLLREAERSYRRALLLEPRMALAQRHLDRLATGAAGER